PAVRRGQPGDWPRRERGRARDGAGGRRRDPLGGAPGGVVQPAGARVPEHPQGIVRAARRPLTRAAVAAKDATNTIPIVMLGWLFHPAGSVVPEHPQGIVRAARRPLTRAAVAAKDATTTIPIVMLGCD